jgi:hypothetical protein
MDADKHGLFGERGRLACRFWRPAENYFRIFHSSLHLLKRNFAQFHATSRNDRLPGG